MKHKCTVFHNPKGKAQKERCHSGLPGRSRPSTTRFRGLFLLIILLCLSFTGTFAQAQGDLKELLRIRAERDASGTRISGDLHALVAQYQQKNRRSVTAISSSAEMKILNDNLYLTQKDGKVGVSLRVENISRIQPELFRLGFEVNAVSKKHGLIEGMIHPANLLRLDELTSYGLLSATAIYKPINYKGSVTSEADVTMRAERARKVAGVDGTGVKIGILSDSYNILGGANAGVASGDLPAGGVTVLDEGDPGNSDEGRAMAELIHDLAPGSDLLFATAIRGESAFANNIQALADAGCKVIVDDIGYFAEPFFQDGIIAQKIDEVAQNQDVVYFAAAGNLGNQAYESTNITFAPFSGLIAYDFEQGTGGFLQSYTLAAGQRLVLSLQWDDPFYTANGVDTDLGILILNQQLNALLGGSNNNNIMNQTPVEVAGYTNNTGAPQIVNVLIFKNAGPDPERIKYVNFGSDVRPNEYDTFSPTMNPHGGANGGIAVGAVPYFNQRVPESFTSQGPHTVLFQANGSPLGFADIRQKPDISAIDNVNNTFFGVNLGEDAFPNFSGTSAAAPHAAAIAALLKENNPTFTRDDIYNALTSTAINLLTPGFDDITGFGLVDAYQAVVGNANLPQSLNITEGFETGTLGAGWDLKSTANGRILITSTNSPASDDFHLTMDNFFDSSPAFSGLNEAILHFDASNQTSVILTFDQREFDDVDHPMSATFSGSENSDGVALSVDGTNWHRIVSLTGGSSTNTYTTQTYDLSQFATDNGLILGVNVRIKFQNFNNFSIPAPNLGGFAFDNIEVQGLSQKPVAVCKNISIPLKADGTVSITAHDVDGGSSDDVGIVGKTIDLNNFTCAQVGQNTITLTVQDADGQTAFCTAIVTVEDNIIPQITCPANISETVAFGVTGKVITYTEPTFSDNCPDANIQKTAGLASGATFPLGTTTVTYLVTDAAGNTDECSFTVTVNAGTPPSNAVTQLLLINADTDTPIKMLQEGDEINLFASPGLSIQAITNPATVGSVRLFLTRGGVTQRNQVENIAPYALNGDANGNFNAFVFSTGTHTITATPYSSTGAGGTAGTPLTINFTVINQAANQLPIAIVTGANQVTDTDNSGSEVVSLSGANSSDPDGGSIVSYAWSEGLTSLGSGVNINPSLSVGTHLITLTVTDDEGSKGSTDFSVTVNPAPPNGPSVSQLVLINADTDTPIRNLAEGDVINLFGSSSLTVQALTSPSAVGSVRFVLNRSGSTVKTQIENLAPYALNGDANGNFNAFVLSTGSYSLTVTPYTAAGAGGTAGTAKIINFTVVNQAPGPISGISFVNAGASGDPVITTLTTNGNVVAPQGSKLSILGNVTVSAGSLRMTLVGGAENINYSRVESILPYALFGDLNNGTDIATYLDAVAPSPLIQLPASIGSYNGVIPPGTYTLTLQLYSGANASGSLLDTRVIQFNLSYGAARTVQASIEIPLGELVRVEKVYPVPMLHEEVTLVLSEALEGEFEFIITDLNGRTLYEGNKTQEKPTKELILKLQQIINKGTFLLEVSHKQLEPTVLKLIQE
ncbi:MAG: HYR domain-containing protein [Microscillaceae bacterium]|nr:HYR domain-containing protein [Microscillaceae bacterium]